MKKKVIFKTEGFVILVLIIAILSLVLFLYLKSDKNSSVPGDLFEGTITNMKTSPGNLSGIGMYDKTCKNIGNGLTRCDAGIKTKKYGVLNFNYAHNMAVEPCIESGNKLKVEILNSNGTARVWRIK